MRILTITEGDETYNYEFPDSWADVTVKQFKEFNQVIKGTVGLETIIKTASLFSGIPEEYIWEFPQSSLTELTEIVSFIIQPLSQEPVDSIEINGELYWVKKDFSQLTIGEVKAIEELMAGDLIENLNLLLAIFIRRKVGVKWEPLTPELIADAQKFDAVKIEGLYGIFQNFQNGEAS